MLFLPLTLALLAIPAQAEDSAQLHDLFKRAWEFSLKERPTFATAVGRHEYNDRLEEVTPADLERQVKMARDFLAELGRIDRSKLEPEDQVSRRISL
jgi:uncharacterized protein (DUF885 family)